MASALAWIGWLKQGKAVGDAAFAAVHVLSVGSDYVDSSPWRGNRWIGLARWLGLIFFITTAVKAFGLVLSRQWGDLVSQLTRRDMVLIGDHPLLEPIAQLIARRRKLLWLVPVGKHSIGGARVVARRWEPRLLGHFRVHRANAILIAYASDDLQALKVATAVMATRPKGEVAVLSSALAALNGLKLLNSVQRVRVIAPEQVSIRALHLSHPPFMTAVACDQRRIHALILGCGDTGELVLADLLLSCLTIHLEQPSVTIVDPRAEEIRLSLLARAPELSKSIDLSFIQPPSRSDPRALPIEELVKAATLPFTVAYVCLSGDHSCLLAATALEALARREAWSLPAIFVHHRHDSEFVENVSPQTKIGRLIPFGGSRQVAVGLGLVGTTPDIMARRLHEAYRAVAPRHEAVDLPWEALSEDVREANRNVFAHLPAKLASAGVPLQDWQERVSEDPDTCLPPFPDLEADDALLYRLSMLEHERWLAERRWAGWCWGGERDDARRLHPDLVPFEHLSSSVQTYDINVIRTLAAVLANQTRRPSA